MKRFLTPFVLVFSGILILGCLIIGFSLATHWAHWVGLIGLALLLWLLPAIYWTSDSEKFSKTALTLQQASFLSMGLLSSLLVMALVHQLLVLFLALAWHPTLIASLQKAVTLTSGLWAFLWVLIFTAIGTLRALRGPRLRHVIVKITGLDKALYGLKIAQISDLHAGPTIGKSYIEKTVALVNQANPDLTVLTGDIVDGNIEDLKTTVEPLSKLAPKGHVFYVPGNHEYYWNFGPWQKHLTSLGFAVLLNRGLPMQKNGKDIWVGGVTDPAAAAFGQEKPNPAKAMDGGANAQFKLLLSHRPNYIDGAAQAGFDLQLSGHTHGGQFFPWTSVGRLFHRYFIGLMHIGGAWLYVSPGTGTWGPPLRIGSTPEVTLIELKN